MTDSFGINVRWADNSAYLIVDTENVSDENWAHLSASVTNRVWDGPELKELGKVVDPSVSDPIRTSFKRASDSYASWDGVSVRVCFKDRHSLLTRIGWLTQLGCVISEMVSGAAEPQLDLFGWVEVEKEEVAQ